MGPSDEKISNAWEITEVSRAVLERDREVQRTEDAREVIELVLGLDWEG